MKKLYTIMTIIMSLAFTSQAWGFSAQSDWRWRNDNGDEKTATWKAVKDSSIYIKTKDNLRLRVKLDNTISGAAWDLNSVLAYKLAEDSVYSLISSDGTKNAFTLSKSTFFKDGDTTTKQLDTLSSSFYRGYIIDSSFYKAISIPQNSYAEMEYCFKPTSNIKPGKYHFRLVNYYSDPDTSYYTELSGMFDSDITLIYDDVAPAILNLRSDTTIKIAQGETQATLSWIEPTAKDSFGIASFTSNYSPGANFNIGSTVVTYTAVDSAGNQTQASFTVKVSDGTGTVSIKESDFKISPNPVNAKLHIISNSIIESVKVFDLSGKQLINSEFNVSEVEVNVPWLKQGIYIAEVKTKAGITRQKFVKN
jgi:HYR domain.